MPTTRHGHRRQSAVRALVPAASAVAIALLLAGCGGDAAGGSDASSPDATQASAKSRVKFDPSLSETPCEVVTVDTVAAVFGMPADEIEQRGMMGMCMYEWKSDEQQMTATIHVTQVSKNAAEAAEYFASVTRGMSGAELDIAMETLRETAGQMGADGAAADAVLGASGDATRSGSSRFQFSDVPGIGDQARMRDGSGDLNVLYGNLHFSLSAEHGPQMAYPANFSELIAASNAWRETTLSQRLEQAIELGAGGGRGVPAVGPGRLLAAGSRPAGWASSATNSTA